MVPNKEEPESDSELTEEDATQPEQPEEPAEPAVENAVAEEPAAEEALQHVVDAAELTKECVDRLVEENGAEKALAEVGKCRVVKLRNLAREYDGLQIAGREISKANKTTLLEELKKYDEENIYIIGGESIYRQMLPYCDVAHVTKIDHAYEADAYFPDLDSDPEWEITADSDEQVYFDITYQFLKYERKKA